MRSFKEKLMMKRKTFLPVLALLGALTLFAGCGGGGGGGGTGGGGGGGGGAPAPGPGPSPGPSTVKKTVSGNVNALSSLVGAKVLRKAQAPLTNAIITIVSYDKSGREIDRMVISSGSSGSFTASLDMSTGGGYIIIEVKKEGFTDYSKRIDFESPSDINLRAELKAVEAVVATAQQGYVFSSALGKKVSAKVFTFGIVRYPDGTKKALAGDKLKAAKAQGGTVVELKITIPADSVPEGTNTLVGRLATFDPSDPNDAKNFPGDYVDSRGNRLVSLAFDYINITDENGRNLGELVRQAKAAGKLKKAQNEPTIITRWITEGNCGNLLQDFCTGAQTDDPLCNNLSDNERNGFNVPVYTYNPYTGNWELLGIGTIDKNDDGQIDSNDIITSDFNGDGIINAKDYQDHCKNKRGEYLLIHVTNEDFGRNWWNLDYPLTFTQPKELCITGTVKDSEGNPISSYLYLYDDDAPQSFNYAYGSTDSSGNYRISVLALDTDRTARLSYYNPYTYSYEETTVTLGDSPNCGTRNIEIPKPRRCTVEGRVVNEAGGGKPDEYVWIYGYYPSYFYTWAYTDNNGRFSVEVACNQNLDVYVGYDWSPKATFNVSGGTNDFPSYENSDNGERVVLKDIVVVNMAPYAYGYLESYSIRTTGSTTIWVYGYDYDGNYPLTYSITSTNASWSPKTGTISSSEWWKEVTISGLSAGTYPLTLTVTDSLGKSSTYDLGTLKVTEPEANRPPVIVYAFPSRYNVSPGDTVSFYAYAYDLDGDTLTYQWSVNGEDVGTGSYITYTIPSGVTEGTVFRVTLTVSDGRGGTAEAQFELLYGSSSDTNIIIR